jgi:hypothetical protein
MHSERQRVALLGDTHGFLDPRVRAVAHGCDVIVHTGDVGGRSVLDALESSGAEVLAVAGNNDTPRHWGEDGPESLAALHEEARLSLPGGDLVVVHGHRLRARDRHARLRARFADVRAVVYGHSHRLTVDREGAPWVLNPGAAGRSRTYGGPACLVLSASPGGWSLETHRFDPARKRARRA